MGIVFFSTTPAEEWIGAIECEIKDKYNILDPIFIFNGEPFKSKEKLMVWIGKVLKEDHWIKYKYLHDNKFELKDFWPDSSDKVCLKLVNSFLKDAKEITQKEYDKSNFFLKIGHGIYNEKEGIKELIFGLRDGDSVIDIENELVPDFKNNNARIIYNVFFYRHELGVDLHSKYVELENKH